MMGYGPAPVALGETLVAQDLYRRAMTHDDPDSPPGLLPTPKQHYHDDDEEETSEVHIDTSKLPKDYYVAPQFFKGDYKAFGAAPREITCTMANLGYYCPLKYVPRPLTPEEQEAVTLTNKAVMVQGEWYSKNQFAKLIRQATTVQFQTPAKPRRSLSDKLFGNGSVEVPIEDIPLPRPGQSFEEYFDMRYNPKHYERNMVTAKATGSNPYDSIAKSYSKKMSHL